jgi:hypothetical protein
VNVGSAVHCQSTITEEVNGDMLVDYVNTEDMSSVLKRSKGTVDFLAG